VFHIKILSNSTKGEKALAEEEVPVGCVFVYKGQIIGSGHNETSKTRNVTSFLTSTAIRSYASFRQLDMQK
jgi:tRNA(Arg) A34 adenosine deaminase TadA